MKMANPVLIVAPTANDSEAACDVLEKAGFYCFAFATLTDLCRALHDDVGFILVAEEALQIEEVPLFANWLENQPPWSDLPVIVLTHGRTVERMNRWTTGQLGSRANVTLLERPFHIATLISVLEGSMRARRRQFETRDLLEQRQRLLNVEKRAREEAEKVNQAKDEFLATLSHELRTPLTIMLGWSKIVNNHVLDEKTITRAMQAIERSAKSQAQLIDDLLDVSRIITGKFQIEKKSMDLVQLVYAAVDMIRPSADAKGIALELHVSNAELPMYADFFRLQQVLWNILSNAVKFTASGGSIHVGLQQTNSNATVIVTDSGKGIRPEFLPHIFERFRQGDSSYTRNQGGLGLGLAIVDHIVALHHGKVSAESDGEGKGSTFRIVLPVGRSMSLQSEKGAPMQPDKETARHLNILVVEDDLESRDLIDVILKQGNGTVRCASTAAEAVDILKDWKPDIIISDIGMPLEDGYQFMMRLRSDPNTRQIPAIALTAYASVADRDKALNAGFQSHLAKPIDPYDLLQAVADLSAYKERDDCQRI
jgi:signal transduction histidine kinase/ActR/RegA family two-component response regulator